MEGMRTRADVQEFRTPATPTSIARPLAMAEGEAVAERANTSSELSQITSLRSLRKVDVVEMADLIMSPLASRDSRGRVSSLRWPTNAT